MTTEVVASPEVEPQTTANDNEIVVVVTLEDIANGVRFDPEQCAIAVAARRMYGNHGWHMGRVLFRSGVAYQNDSATDWVYRFDMDRSNVAPERFVFKRM